MQGDITQLGIAGATLAILFFIVRYFITAIERKDAYIKSITEQFAQTISDNLKLSQETHTRQLAILDEHTKVLSSHTQVLERLAASVSVLSNGRSDNK